MPSWSKVNSKGGGGDALEGVSVLLPCAYIDPRGLSCRPSVQLPCVRPCVLESVYEARFHLLLGTRPDGFQEFTRVCVVMSVAASRAG